MTQHFDFFLQNTALYPFRFTPIYKDYLWGGNKFRTLFGRPIPSELQPLAESWEITDHPNGRSVVRNGPLRGKTLQEIVLARPLALFGKDYFDTGRPPDRFPLILKYLDAARPLSVQVHPDDRLAAEMELEDRGKTEVWLVVDAGPDGAIWLGTRSRMPRDELAEFIRDGKLASILNKIHVEVGDCFYIRPGTLHALGADVLVVEVQTCSDTTFRVFDWDRVDKDGKPRELKIDEAVRALNELNEPVYPRKSRYPDTPFCEQLVSDPGFTVNRWTFKEPYSWTSDGRCHIWSVLEGAADAIFKAGRRETPRHMSGRDQDPDAIEPLNRGDSLLVPAMCNGVRWIPENGRRAVLIDVAVERCG